MKESEDILRKILTETREIPVDHVPYAFEKRIMAHIEAAPKQPQISGSNGAKLSGEPWCLVWHKFL